MKKAIVQFPSNSSYSEHNINGYILFTQNSRNCDVTVEVNLYGLPSGKHGFHIHEHPIKPEYIEQLKRGEKIKDLCATLGGHFNPYETVHGSYKYNTQRHCGDLINNLYVNRTKKVNIVFIDSLISLYNNDINCILNKSIVIHDKPDDEGIRGYLALKYNKKLNKSETESLKTGNAKKRIACGNINDITYI